MGDADGTSDAEWVAYVRGLDVYKAWSVLKTDGQRLVETDAGAAEEILVRFCGTRQAVFQSLHEPDFLSSLRDSVLWPDASAIPHLPHAVGMAAGWISSREALQELGGGTRRSSSFDRSEQELRADRLIGAAADPWLSKLWHHLYLLLQMDSADPIELAGMRGTLSELAHGHPDGWIDLLPWLLCLQGSKEAYVVDLTIEIMLGRPELLEAVRRYENHLYPRVALRSAGLVRRTRAVSVEDWAVEVAAVQLDRRRDVYPRPLAEPASTWIGDRDLEDLIRGAARQAIREFAPHAVSQGGAEEEGLTSALLMSLGIGFKEVANTLHVTTNRRATAPAVSLSQRVVPKKEEKRLRADVCILVDVEMAGEVKVRFGDLVQVKKSGLFGEPDARQESWRIDLSQLRELLELSATATYWLIRSDGELLVVPGKLLLGIVDETAKPLAKSRTVHYTEVRHAAVSLGSYLCDLMMGMWLGTSNAEILERIDGTNAQTTPAAILQVTVRRQPG